MIKYFKKTKYLLFFISLFFGFFLFFNENVFADYHLNDPYSALVPGQIQTGVISMQTGDIASWRAYANVLKDGQSVGVETANCQIELYETSGWLGKTCHRLIFSGDGIVRRPDTAGTVGCVRISRFATDKLPEKFDKLSEEIIPTSTPRVIPQTGIANDGLNVAWPVLGGNVYLNKNSTLEDLARYLYTLIIALAGIATFGSFVFAGFEFVTSAGNANKMSSAKGRMISTTIGLIFVLISFIILNTINPALTVFELPKFTVPGLGDTIKTPENADLVGPPCETVRFYNKNNFGRNVNGELVAGTRCVAIAVNEETLNQPIQMIEIVRGIPCQ